MTGDLNRRCDLHERRADCPDTLIARMARAHDGGSGVIRIAFRPWCGTKLPSMD